MEVIITHEITEYACLTPKKYEYVSFCSNKKSVVISLLNEKEKVIIQTEIDVNEFLKTAEIIKQSLF